MKFTNRSIAALKPKSERFEVWEDGQGGFGMRVSPKGSKSWIFLYRYQGRPRRMTLGNFPAMGLADAHVALANAKKALTKDIDPGTKAVETKKAEREAETVNDLIEEYMKRHSRPNKRTCLEDERSLKSNVAPVWGRRKVKDISRRDVIRLIDKVVDRGSPIMANRLLALIRHMMGLAVEREIIPFNPALGIKSPSKEVKRDRYLDKEEIKKLWHGLNQTDINAAMKLALRLLLVTGQRRGEVTEARWDEIDLDGYVWNIPAERSKNGRAHKLPLSELAIEVLTEAKELSGEAEWIFPGRHIARTGEPIRGKSLGRALHRNLKDLGIQDFTVHDLRRTVASHLAEMGIARLTIAKVLNHADRDVTAIYDRHAYQPEMREALEAWSRQLKSIISGQEAASNVVPINKPA